MTERQPARAEVALERRCPDAGLHGHSRGLAVELKHARHATHVECEHAAVLTPQRRYAAHYARAAAERHDRERAACAQLEQCAQLLVPGRVDDRVGRPLGFARAQAHQIGIALAARVLHAF